MNAVAWIAIIVIGIISLFAQVQLFAIRIILMEIRDGKRYA